MKKIIWIILLLFVFTCSLCACSASKLNDREIQEAVNAFLESNDNPLRDSYQKSEYKLNSVDANDESATAQILVIQESAKTHYEVTILAKYRSEKGNWILQSGRVQNDAVFYPLQAPNEKDLEPIIEEMKDYFGKETDCKIDITDWKKKSNRIHAQLTVTDTNYAYIHTVFGECALEYLCYSEEWSIQRGSYLEKSKEVDFSPLNGTWNAVYKHSSRVLTKKDIPFTFTFSDAGKIKVENNNYSSTTVTVNHQLNDIYEDYINPEFTGDNLPEWGNSYAKGVRYDIGKMDIRHNRSDCYVIEFEMVLINKDEHIPCSLEIYSDRIIFTQMHGDICRLTKS